MPSRINVLFVCGRNNRRGPTAERLFKRDRRMDVRAVGLHETSARRMTEADVKWADLILVMERKYTGRIRDTYRHMETLPPIESLNIADEYIFMDPALLEILPAAVNRALEDFQSENVE